MFTQTTSVTLQTPIFSSRSRLLKFIKKIAVVSSVEYLMEEALNQVIKNAVDFTLRTEFDEDLGPDMRETFEENGEVNVEGDEESEEDVLKRYEEEDYLALTQDS